MDEELADNGAFRVRVKQAGKYILDGMMLLRGGLGCLAILLLLILVCCIMSAIFLGFDLKSDMTTSVKLVFEEPPPIVDGGDGGGAPESTCSDGNVCTVDYERELGGCESIPSPVGTACEDICNKNVSEQTCQLVELQKGIKKSMCIGECAGKCVKPGSINCPDIMTAQPCEPVCRYPGETESPPFTEPGEICYDAPRLDVHCRSSVCFYTVEPPPRSPNNPNAPHFLVEDIPPYGCRNNEWFQSYCMSLISDEDPYKKCLVAVVECLEEWGRLVPDNDDDDSNDVFVIPPQCHFHFWCSAESMIPFDTEGEQQVCLGES